MEGHRSSVAVAAHWIHRHLLWLLIGCYVIAALAPGPGLWVRQVSFSRVAVFGETLAFSVPVLLLSLLLWNAGLGVRIDQLRRLVASPVVLTVGLAANVLVPLLFIAGVAQAMRFWHNPDEVQNILVGLALVAAMPIAGSSTAWSQNANGDLALSLGLVLGSTLLSPLTTPLALRSVGHVAAGDYAQELEALAGAGTSLFLVLGVLAPILLGFLTRTAAGAPRVNRCQPALKLANSVCLLVLVYSNASLSLPESVANPDPDFLAAILAVVVSLCGLAFASGWVLGRLLRADRPQRMALMFGLGMNNNGTGLVLASMALAAYPRVMLPIIFYNLIQHLAAGLADRVCSAEPRTPFPKPVGTGAVVPQAA